jgi:hypothetical protein
MSEYDENLDALEETGGDEPLAFSTAEKLGRRSFMQKLVMGAMGLATALVGLPQKAEALVSVACCVLCKSSTGGCTGACCWTWGCCYAADNDRFYNCKECYSAGAACNGSCSGVVCSQAMRTQLLC